MVIILLTHICVTRRQWVNSPSTARSRMISSTICNHGVWLRNPSFFPYLLMPITHDYWSGSLHNVVSWTGSSAKENWPWWRHQMETFSALLAICAGNSPVTGEFPAQTPVTRSVDGFFDQRLNKRLSEQCWGWWFETPSCPLWCHCIAPRAQAHPILRAITLRSGRAFLLDTLNCGLRMCRECRERFPRHRLQRKPLVGDPGMHHGTCVTQVPWCMSTSLTRGCGENVPGIPSACATLNFTYLERGPWVGCPFHEPGRVFAEPDWRWPYVLWYGDVDGSVLTGSQPHFFPDSFETF